MFYWIYDLPTWTLVFMFCSFFVGITWLGTIFIRPLLRTILRQQGLNDIVGYLLGAHGVYFGILLGLLALSAYENFADTERLAVDEATKLAALYRDVKAYPQPVGNELADRLKVYTKYVIDKAWPLQKFGRIPLEGTIMIGEFQDKLASFEPKTPGQQILHAEAYHQFNEFSEARRHRLHAVTTGIPAILWWVVFIGAGVNILLLLMLEIRLVPHLILGGVISFYLATLIALIAAMDNPFRGEVSISAEAYVLVYETVMNPKPVTGPTEPPKAPNPTVSPPSGMTPAPSSGAIEPPKAPRNTD
jgi:hypothetical protein